jgi:hypothetical protein
MCRWYGLREYRRGLAAFNEGQERPESRHLEIETFPTREEREEDESSKAKRLVVDPVHVRRLKEIITDVRQLLSIFDDLLESAE